MSLRRIAVCGGGNGALAAAGDLALRGFEVRLALRNRERFDELFRTGVVRLEGAIEGEAELELVTDDHAEAVRGAELVVVPLPARAQVEMAARIAPALEEGQVLYLTKGTLASPLVRRTLREAGAPDVPIAENPILPWGVRVSGPASARVAMVAERLPTSVFPAAAGDALAAVAEAFPATEPAEDALDVALLNSDPALHAPLVLMNAGPIENLPDFDVHTEGNPPSVVAASLALDEERLRLREALGYAGHPWPLADLYSRTRPTFYGVISVERMRGNSVWREKLDFHHRYVTEDVGCGLALWSSLGRRLGVATPLADAFQALAAAVVGPEGLGGPWTLERLGVPDLPPAGLRAWFRTGGREPAEAPA